MSELRKICPFLSILLFLLIQHTPVAAQEVEDADAAFRTIRAALADQQDAWNRADIDAFMEYYWRSEQLQFVGAAGPTYGWQNTLDNYKKRYPGPAAMGKLRFDILKMNRRGKKVITVVGKFNLTRDMGDLSGYFTLIWQKIRGRWLIVADHTS